MQPGLPYSGVSERKDSVVLYDHQRGRTMARVGFNTQASLSYHRAQCSICKMGTVTMYGAGMFRELPSETTSERHLARG